MFVSFSRLSARMRVKYPDVLVQFGDGVLCGFFQLQKFGLFIQFLLQISYLTLKLLETFAAALTQPKHRGCWNED